MTKFVLEQTYKDFKIIAINYSRTLKPNNCSSEKSSDIALTFVIALYSSAAERIVAWREEILPCDSFQ